MQIRIDQKQLRYWALFGILSCLLAFWRGPVMIAGFVVVSMVWFFSYHLSLGWYVLVGLSPMIHWVLRFSDYWYLFTDYPKLLTIYAPVVEFWTLLLILAWVVSLGRSYLQGESISVRAPGGWLFLLFFGSALLSLTSVSSVDLLPSLYQIVRQLVFLYIGYVVLGANILRTAAQVRTALQVFLGVSVCGALMGAVSLLSGMSLAEFGYIRAVPFGFGAWAPFGYQHIFLAETITVGIPIAMYAWYTAREQAARRWYRALYVLLLVVGLLTLSRAAWVVLAVETILFLYLVRPKGVWRTLGRYRWQLGTLAIVVLGYFFYFLFANPNVSSSTSARLLLTDVSFFMLLDRPIVGQGFSQFQPYADSTLVVMREIGGGQDAHGVLQKILSEQGVVGGITGFLFIGYFLLFALRRVRQSMTNPMVVLGVFVILSPLLFQIFNTQYYASTMWVPIILGYMTLVHAKKEQIDFLQV